MKAYQRIIRETMALTPEPDEEEKREAAASFKNASVREISYAEASTIILRYEWLQTWGLPVTVIASGFFPAPRN